MTGSSSEDVVEVESDDNFCCWYFGISIIYILVIRMVEDASAERYCVSFLQNLFYDSTISGRSWRGNSKLLLHLHCNSTCCQNSSDLMVHLKWLLLLSKLVRIDGVCLMVHLWPRFCVCLEDFVKEVFSPILHERLLCHWEGWEIPLCIPYHSLREAGKLRRGKFRSNHPPTLG